MPRIIDCIRRHLLESLGMPTNMQLIPSLEELRRTEWSPHFEQLMRNRLIVGAFRFGLFSSPDKTKYDFVKGAQSHIADYVATGNTEHLVDAANGLLLEFAVGTTHLNKHFAASDNHADHAAHFERS